MKTSLTIDDITRYPLLHDLAQVLHDRECHYGHCENNLKDIARMWSVLLNVDITEAQVKQCMIAFKLVRLKVNPKHKDSWIDVAGYAVLESQ